MRQSVRPREIINSSAQGVDESPIVRLPTQSSADRCGSTTPGAEASTGAENAATDWHLITIKPGGLERALRCIAWPPRGIPVWRYFNPMLVMRATRTNRVSVQLFPGYLFLRFDASRDPWGSLRHTPGVSGIVSRPDGTPETMPVSTMADLLAEPERIKPGADMAPGTTVRIDDGVFAGFVGEIIRLSGNDRVRLLLDVLGGHHEVEAPLRAVRLA